MQCGFLTSSLFLAAAFLGSTAAHAHLSISTLWVEFQDGGAGRSDVVIRNDSEDRYYISVTATEVSNPGSEEEERVSLPDPEAAGLLVTPNRMILDPGALRSIRLVSLNKELSQDRVYRVLIAPQVGEIKAERLSEDGTGLVVKMLAAYEVLVIARPRGSRPEIRVARVGDHATITNSGSTNILMTDASACPAAVDVEDPACTRLPATRLYAGNNITLPLASAQDKIRVTTRSRPGSDPVTTEY